MNNSETFRDKSGENDPVTGGKQTSPFAHSQSLGGGKDGAKDAKEQNRIHMLYKG